MSCAGVRYHVDAHDVLSVPVPPCENGRNADSKVLYADVALAECVDAVMGIETLEYRCPNCQRDVAATQQKGTWQSQHSQLLRKRKKRTSRHVDSVHCEACRYGWHALRNASYPTRHGRGASASAASNSHSN